MTTVTKKMAKDFKKGEIFKRYSNWNEIEYVWVEKNKTTFQYTSSEGIKNWATYKNETLIQIK